eukprot:scaffold141981_cov31-Tisochrysis_lutea.AAC.2
MIEDLGWGDMQSAGHDRLRLAATAASPNSSLDARWANFSSSLLSSRSSSSVKCFSINSCSLAEFSLRLSIRVHELVAIENCGPRMCCPAALETSGGAEIFRAPGGVCPHIARE